MVETAIGGASLGAVLEISPIHTFSSRCQGPLAVTGASVQRLAQPRQAPLGSHQSSVLPEPLERLIFPLLFSVSSFVKNAPPILLNLGRTRREAGGEQA